MNNDVIGPIIFLIGLLFFMLIILPPMTFVVLYIVKLLKKLKLQNPIKIWWNFWFILIQKKDL